MLERTQWARDLATVLREVAAEMRLPMELRAEAAKDDADVLRQRVDQALTSLLAVERDHWAPELSVIFCELADELDPPLPAPTVDRPGHLRALTIDSISLAKKDQ